MFVEAVVTVIGIACSLPAVIADLTDEFAPAERNTWVKITPQVLLFLSLSCRKAKPLIWVSFILSILGLIATYFCLLFNTRAATTVVCEGYSTACVDYGESTCSGGPFEPWEGLFYMVGICFMTVGSSILIRDNWNSIREKKVVPT